MFGIIYKVTNKVNLKIYIGQTTIGIKKRMRSHKSDAKLSKSNSYFHNAIRKYGWDSFSWEEIYTSFSMDDLNEKEIYFIELFQSQCTNNGYNIAKGGNFINPLHIPEVKERWYRNLCSSMKQYVGDNNVMKRADVKEKHHSAVIKLSQDPNWIEAKHKGDETIKSSYEVTFPDGHVEIITGLNQFCKDNNLSQSKMSSVVTSNRPHHKGFKCKRIKQGNKSIGNNNINKTYTFITPNGEVIIIDNLNQFCKEYGLSYTCMLYVSQGKQTKHKGYSIHLQP